MTNSRNILSIIQKIFPQVIGEKEKNAGTVNVRTRDNVVHGETSVDDLLKNFQQYKESKENTY